MKKIQFFAVLLLSMLSVLIMSCKDDDANTERFQSELVGSMDMEILTDTETGLVWVNDARGCFAAIIIATTECDDLTFAGQSDWRTPSQDELVELLTEIDARDMNLNYINPDCGLMSTADTTVWVFTENTTMAGSVTMNKPGNAGIRCVRNQ